MRAWPAGLGLGVLLCACTLPIGASAQSNGGTRAPALAGWSTVETQHFRFHFPPEPIANPSTFPGQLEAAYAELSSAFSATLPGKIDFYVWNSRDAGEKLLGRPPGFASGRHLLIHATADQTVGHELTHVLVHYSATPEVTTRFISEGTAVAFDLTKRDRLAMAKASVRGQAPPGALARLWNGGDAAPESVLYPVAGAFVERLYAQGGRDRFFRLLKRQTLEHAREVYGADLERIMVEFEKDLSSRPDGSSGGLEELRAKAQARMRRDRDIYTLEQLREIESLYQSASKSLGTPEGRKLLLELTEKYPKANRTGCAVLYLAQGAAGGEREALLKRAIADHGDAWYGDGTQVGAYGRALLAMHYASTNRRDEALALAAEVERLFPGAVEHSGALLTDLLKKLAP